jgi:hypothetical protein
MLPKISSMILWKKVGRETKYMFLTVMDSLEDLKKDININSLYTKNIEGMIESPFLVMKKTI